MYAFGGAWAGDSVNAVAALFGWFYDDGWGGSKGTWNFDCGGPTASGCWGHRDELLGEWAGTGCTDCIAGAGYASPAARHWKESYDFLWCARPSWPRRSISRGTGMLSRTYPGVGRGWRRPLEAGV
jgi:hypothetical protein